MTGRRLCAIHQPNFFPRLRTLAKLYAADVWVVLDDVQFCRRDYQHRARFGQLHDPSVQQWLSLNVHLSHGRATRINEARLVEPELCQRRVDGMVTQYFARSPYWHRLQAPLEEVVTRIGKTDYLNEVAEISTRVLLDFLGWRGKIVHSSDFAVRHGRSERLADLTKAVGVTTYLCSTGGARYLDEGQFTDMGIRVEYAQQPAWIADDLWQRGQNLSVLWAMACGVVDFRTRGHKSSGAHAKREHHRPNS